MSQVAHQAGAYLSFCNCSMKWLEVVYFYSSLNGMLVHHSVTPSIKFTGTHLYTRVEQGTESKVSYPRTQHSVPGQGLNADRSIRRQAH